MEGFDASDKYKNPTIYSNKRYDENQNVRKAISLHALYDNTRIIREIISLTDLQLAYSDFSRMLFLPTSALLLYPSLTLCEQNCVYIQIQPFVILAHSCRVTLTLIDPIHFNHLHRYPFVFYILLCFAQRIHTNSEWNHDTEIDSILRQNRDCKFGTARSILSIYFFDRNRIGLSYYMRVFIFSDF